MSQLLGHTMQLDFFTSDIGQLPKRTIGFNLAILYLGIILRRFVMPV